jgi:hypothetical protein
MIAFGVAEIVTSFTHAFFGLATERSAGSTVLGATLGVLYVMAGGLALGRTRTRLRAALICLGFDVLGRVGMVATGWFAIATRARSSASSAAPSSPSPLASTCTQAWGVLMTTANTNVPQSARGLLRLLGRAP